MRVFACHLLNDYSGSPKVLMQLVKSWVRNGLEVTIVTCSGRSGFLSDLPARYNLYWYKWSANPLLRLINFFTSQVFLFMRVLRLAQPGDVVYVNTVLPFGAALAGRLKGCKVVYHVHETSVKPKILKTFLFAVVKLCATEVIYVSNYLGHQEKIPKVSTHILYNAIEQSFLDTALAKQNTEKERKHVLMISSLKAYKGVNEFVSLAQLNPQFSFRLVVNASPSEIDRFFGHAQRPANLAIYPTQRSTHVFYNWADIVLNLSRPDAWVETFGLTILEGMAYGLPAIVPPVGGITELVEEGVNGALADSRDIATLSEKLSTILNHPLLYQQMRQNAFSKLAPFKEDVFEERSLKILGCPRLTA